MAANPQIVVDFLANTSQLSQASSELGAKGAGAGKAMRGAFLPAVATLGLITAGAKQAVDAASSLNEQMSASTQVFGKHAKGVQDWAKTGAQAFGLSTREALAAAVGFGAMAQSAGLTQKESAGLSQNMVQLAGDMASFFDQDPSRMLEALRSGLAGESEPLRRFGINLDAAAVAQKAYQMGIAKTGSELTQAQKVQARYAIIMEQTTKAQGDFARTGDSVANQQRTLAAETENASASLGTALLPAMQAIQTVMGAVIGLLARLGPGFTILVGAVAALATVVIAANAAMTIHAALQTIMALGLVKQAAAWWVLNAAMFASPWVWVAVGIVAVIAAVILLIKYWDEVKAVAVKAWDAIKAAAMVVWNWLKSNWPLIVAILAGPIGIAVLLIARHWDQIKALVGAAVNWIRGVWSALTGALSAAMSGAAGAIGGAWDRIERAARSTVDFVRGVWSAMTGFLASTLQAAVGAVSAAWHRIEAAAKGVIDGIKRAWDGLVNAVEGITGRIKNMADTARAAVNFIIDRWNNLRIPGIDINVKGPGPLPDLKLHWGGWDSPNINRLAAGGIVTRPTLALIGEAGPEAVVPLSGGGLSPSVDVRVYIGDQELKGMVRYEVRTEHDRLAQTLLGGLV